MNEPIEILDMSNVEVDPDYCKHNWEHCLTPPDSGYKWYRCIKCGAFGHLKRPYHHNRNRKAIKIPYRCSLPKCNGIAIDRKIGRGPRCSYLWRCKDHVNTD
jgi:hypothetical protein